MHPIELHAILISDFLTTQDFMQFMKLTKCVYNNQLKKTRKWRRVYMEIRHTSCLTKKGEKLYNQLISENDTSCTRELLQVKIIIENGVKSTMIDKNEIIAVVPWIFRKFVKFEICNGHWEMYIDYDGLLAYKLQKYVYKQQESMLQQEKFNLIHFEKLTNLVKDLDNFKYNDHYKKYLQLYEYDICKKAKHRTQLANPIWD